MKSKIYCAVFFAVSLAVVGRAAPPGVVIDHISAATGTYIGSPSLAVLPDGNYIASHDYFGPKSTEKSKALTAIFRSTDRGQTWKIISQINGQFWSTLFVHRGALYIIGTDKQYGNAIIRRSKDGGVTWTSPENARTGLLRDNGQYHCAPMLVVEHDGRLWRPMERRDPPKGWGKTFCAGMLSVPTDADLLDAKNWTFSNFLEGDTNWLDGAFGGWLEGNAVVTPEGRVIDLLRVETPGYPEKAAIVSISSDGKTASFDPETGFIDFPGGAKKFAIRFDKKSKCYWTLANFVPESAQTKARPSVVRNRLALVRSENLIDWETRCILLQHPDSKRHGFQYVDGQLEGDDMIAVCRTAFEDADGGAHSYHDANYLTFHRIKNFRTLTMADSVKTD